nr:hypothetical protein [Sunxiuqinia sp.]
MDASEPVFRGKGKDAIELPINKTEVLSQFVSYAIGVFLGPYRLDKPGLNVVPPSTKHSTRLRTNTTAIL